MGVFAFFLNARRASLLIVAAALAIGMLILILSFYSDVATQHEYSALRFFFWGVPAATLVLICASIEERFGWPLAPLITHLGSASYSTYLSHFFTLGMVTKIGNLLWLPSIVGDEGIFALCLAGSLVVGSVVHVTVEKPLLRLTGV